ncbi:hypothetical protein P175DRAFT_0489445 [Aspergillus ochraceoroseus IBT 24754]|uniref:C3H1-type domain-containing protein n=3 Tax=Aspergillus subgen. Nidulantes TaxID=2720870 RepID=A0A0F8V8X5_9EURO|nr:uncharacterized protein P175DRAFT_0489445 [Aspergillus ochraceoroseus IBT 24754]KKK19456.1 hypothetical protein ARAM_004142 [Aspergillus rambellii]KKK24147.1 hypothetical protein AOCH_003487 [Aspergillus ochraceoroseus]PTU24315.1 hypothetical protein P175DRAFT_0489445 [Aspergillus ochraceoroseus IBT 24754]
MSSPLRPQFFCARPNGTLVPLISVDELPAHLSIRGAPRVLSPNETQGMTSLGTLSPRAQFYTVEGAAAATTRPPSSNAANHRSRNHDLQSSLMRLLADENIPANQRLALHALLQQGMPQNHHTHTSQATGWLVPNSGGGSANGSPRQKEYCSYWIRHGECDYQQQGCLYKHEMPHDPSMLEKLGLRDIPRWYREKYGISSILPNGHAHPRPHPGNGHQWKDDRAAIKSIQYPSRLTINGVTESSEPEHNPKQKTPTFIPHQQQAPSVVPGGPQIAYQGTSSSATPVSQKQGLKSTASQLNIGGKKIGLFTFDRLQDYTSCNPLVYHPAKESSFEASDKAQRQDLVRNLQSLVPAPIPTNADYLPSPFDSHLGSSHSKKIQKSRRLYQPRSHDAMPESGPDVIDSDSMPNTHQNLAIASSSTASVASKTTGSQFTSPVVDNMHSSTTSEPPTRGASPHSGASFSSGTSPGILRSRNKDKAPRRAPGAIGTKRVYRKRSVGSSEEDLFGFGNE